ncbi:MAG: hypothetical protein LBT03_02515 [Holosporales bacterium]|jgi:hypothetical protein|nr:hypothetical protein [Holosporales bacterium]
MKIKSAAIVLACVLAICDTQASSRRRYSSRRLTNITYTDGGTVTIYNLDERGRVANRVLPDGRTEVFINGNRYNRARWEQQQVGSRPMPMPMIGERDQPPPTEGGVGFSMDAELASRVEDIPPPLFPLIATECGIRLLTDTELASRVEDIPPLFPPVIATEGGVGFLTDAELRELQGMPS